MMKTDPNDTALVITDPQNDFLSPEGVTWGMVGDSVLENKTVEHIEELFKAAKQNGLNVFISPHYYYPTDHGWKIKQREPQHGYPARAIEVSGRLGCPACRPPR